MQHDLVEAHATVQSKEVISFERTHSNRVSFVTDKDLWGRNVLHIDSIATCSLETDHLFIVQHATVKTVT